MLCLYRKYLVYAGLWKHFQGSQGSSWDNVLGEHCRPPQILCTMDIALHFFWKRNIFTCFEKSLPDVCVATERCIEETAPKNDNLLTSFYNYVLCVHYNIRTRKFLTNISKSSAVYQKFLTYWNLLFSLIPDFKDKSSKVKTLHPRLHEISSTWT
jgi:hypothetical protein